MTSIEVDETQPLLKTTPEVSAPAKITPLPWAQIAIVLSVEFAEPFTYQLLWAFETQLIAGLEIVKGDPEKVGYYVGVLESIYYAVQSVCIFPWNRLSDHIGRKPIMLIGLAGICLAMTSVGLAQTFRTLVLCRCLAALLDGNMGMVKVSMAELTDETNMPQGFALLRVTWCAGAAIAPIIGGAFSRPAERFPSIFTSQLWHDYPYLFPCLISASVAAASFFAVFFYMHETLTNPSKGPQPTPGQIYDSKPPSIQSLFIPPVIISLGTYGVLALFDMGYNALLPVFYSLPIELGGLGFDSPTIGRCIGALGLLNGVAQLLFLAPLIHKFGPRKVIIAGALAWIPIYSIFPMMNAVARAQGISGWVWFLLVLQLVFQVVMDLSFGAVLMLISSSAPTRRSLGSVNGMSQIAGAVGRSIGPALATSLFSYAVETKWLGGNAAYPILAILSMSVLLIAVKLPPKYWQHT